MSSQQSATVCDLLVLGSGVAGLAAATHAALKHNLNVAVVTKASIEMSTTQWAQGGVAVELDRDPEGIHGHITDTLAAGAGLCDQDAVTTLVTDGPEVVQQLIDLGARFDATIDGQLALATEGGHSRPRVIHAGGAATGAEIERALVAATINAPIAVFDHAFATELLMDANTCVGASVLTRNGVMNLHSRHTMIATGGSGQLYSVTTNPPLATGDGLALAVRAGAHVTDLEFMQFHPTALHHDMSPRSLITEALRGHGAVLRNTAGERFVDELLPRDVVSQAIVATMKEWGSDHVWLDATQLTDIAHEFPTICAALANAGYDPRSEWIPVAPAAHHQCGGIAVDLDGATTVPRLWAVGEVSCTGSHGANRLASNSLLEGLVFGTRAVNAIVDNKVQGEPSGVLRSVYGQPSKIGAEQLVVSRLPENIGIVNSSATFPHSNGNDGEAGMHRLRKELQSVMFNHVGLARDHDSISFALQYIAENYYHIQGLTPSAIELNNLFTVARLVCIAAGHRTESRGTHRRTDHPSTDPKWERRIVLVEEHQ